VDGMAGQRAGETAAEVLMTDSGGLTGTGSRCLPYVCRRRIPEIDTSPRDCFSGPGTLKVAHDRSAAGARRPELLIGSRDDKCTDDAQSVP